MARPGELYSTNASALPYNRAMSEFHTAAQRTNGESRLLTLVAGAAGALLFLLLFYPILRGNIYQGSDIGSQQFLYRSFYSNCLQNGYSFLWWPQEFCGYYLHGEGQGAFFHPLQWLTYRFLPLPTAFNVEFMTSYLFLYGGMVCLIRRLKQPWFAALFGANLFTFSGFILYHFTHIQAVRVISHLPWIILAVHILLTAQHPTQLRRGCLALIALVASQLLSGYPQYVLFTLLAVGIYGLFFLPQAGFGWRAGLILATLATALLCAGVQVLPTFDLIHYAARHGVEDFWKEGSLHPINLLQWVSPYWFANGIAYGIPEWEYTLYVGAVPTVLFLLGRANRDTPPDVKTMGRYGVALALIAVILALGSYGGVYRLVAALPVMGSFRCPTRHLVLAHVAVALLSAFSVARLAQRRGTPTSYKGIAILLVAVWLMVPLILILKSQEGLALHDAFSTNISRLLMGPILLSVAVGVFAGTFRWPKAGVAALMLIATIDSAVYTMPFVWNHKPQSTTYTSLQTALSRELPDDADFAANQSLYRAHGNWRIARLTQLGLSDYQGYVGLPPAWHLDPNAETTKQLAGVRWEKVPLTAAEWTVRETALPMVRLLSTAVVSDSPRDTIENIDITTTAIVEKPIDIHASNRGTVEVRINEPGRMELKVETPSEQLLVFAQRYHPGWQVELDNRPTELFRVNGDFMGCLTSDGEQTVTFTFQPRSFHYGLMVSGVGVIFTACLWIVLGRSKRVLSLSDAN